MIKEDLVRVFTKFHKDGIINQRINATFIALMPKKVGPKNFQTLDLST